MIWECIDDIGDFWGIIYDKRSELWVDAGVEDDDADSEVEAWLNPAMRKAPAPTEKAGPGEQRSRRGLTTTAATGRSRPSDRGRPRARRRLGEAGLWTATGSTGRASGAAP